MKAVITTMINVLFLLIATFFPSLTVDAAAPKATRESMFGAPWSSVLKPTLKYRKFTNNTGTSNKSSVRATTIIFSWPRNNAGSGHPSMCPMLM